MNTKNSKGSSFETDIGTSKRSLYYCNVVHSFKNDLEFDLVRFSPKNDSSYEWQLMAKKCDGDISLSLHPCFQCNKVDGNQILSFSYTLSVDDSAGNLVNQWKVKNIIHSDRENIVGHVVTGLKSMLDEMEWSICLNLTFSVLPMGDFEAVPKRCMPLNTSVRVVGHLDGVGQPVQEEKNHFRSWWTATNARIDALKEGDTVYENVFSSSDESGCSMSLEVRKGSVSFMILTEFFPLEDPSKAELGAVGVRYELSVENSKRGKIVQWNVNCSYSTSLRFLQTFPIEELGNYSGGSLVFSMSGAFIKMIPYDDKVLKTGLCVTDCVKERQFFRSLLADPSYGDVVLVFDDSDGHHEIRCHRVILAARSPVFHSMFSKDPQKQNSVKIPDVDLKCVQNMLDYVYWGKCDENMSSTEAQLLLQAAQNYGLLELKKHCEVKLMRALRPSNVLELFKTSEISEANDLQNMIFDFVCGNSSVLDEVNNEMRSNTNGGLDSSLKYKFMTEILIRNASKIIPGQKK